MSRLLARLAVLQRRPIDDMLASYEGELRTIARQGRYSYTQARAILADVAALCLAQPLYADGTIDFERFAREIVVRFGWLGLTYEQVMRDGARLAREEGRDWGEQPW
jgi:hypothetical protein